MSPRLGLWSSSGVRRPNGHIKHEKARKRTQRLDVLFVPSRVLRGKGADTLMARYDARRLHRFRGVGPSDSTQFPGFSVHFWENCAANPRIRRGAGTEVDIIRENLTVRALFPVTFATHVRLVLHVTFDERIPSGRSGYGRDAGAKRFA